MATDSKGFDLKCFHVTRANFAGTDAGTDWAEGFGFKGFKKSYSFSRGFVPLIAVCIPMPN